uniref:KIB1-4 beta-propeller domain-containing protein n=1 Tax=Fagus sylvatica TaxID=28930 RepID=A0A2N9INT4_FAGSY
MFRMSSYPISGVRSHPGYQGLKIEYGTDKKQNMYMCSSPLRIKSSSLSASPSDSDQAVSQHETYQIIVVFVRFNSGCADSPNNTYVRTNDKLPKEVNDAICIGSSHGWLAYISRRDCSIFLWNPFITSPDPSSLISLPTIDTLPHVTVVPLGESGYCDGAYCSSTTSNISRSAYEDEFSPDFNFKVEYKEGVVGFKGREPIKEFSRIEDVIHFKDNLFYTVSFGGTTIVAYDLADLSSPKSYFLKASFNFKHPCLAIHGTRSWSAVTKHYSSHVDDMANMVTKFYFLVLTNLSLSQLKIARVSKRTIYTYDLESQTTSSDFTWDYEKVLPPPIWVPNLQ